MRREVKLVRCASSDGDSDASYGVASDAPLVVLNCFGDEGEAVACELDKLVGVPYSLLAINVSDWNSALSPWKAPAVFKGEGDFGCGADEYIAELVDEIVPAACSEYGVRPRAIYIAVESMARLLALSSLYKTDFFAGCAEAKTKNPVMATVEDKTRGIAERYKAKGYDVRFEMNQGGHFNDPELRTAKGIAWVIK